MRSLKQTAIAAAAALRALGSPAVAQVTDYHAIKTPALHSFSVKEPTRLESSESCDRSDGQAT